METHNENSDRSRHQQQPGDQSSEKDLNINEDVSGNDSTDEGRDERSHHQKFGNRKYESHSNHSSNDDQPMTDTSPTGSSPELS